MNFKLLNTDFTKNGFTFKQIARQGDVALYSRSKNDREHFEVVIVGRHNGYELGGVKIEPAETYPSSEQWGAKGWTVQSKDRGWEKFQEVVKQYSSKVSKSE